MRFAKIFLVTAAVVAGFSPATAAQQPRLTNAQVETRSAAGGLEPALRGLINSQQEAAWIGYAVPAQDSGSQMCCNYFGHGDSGTVECGGHCRLEDSGGSYSTSSRERGVALEAQHVIILLRAEQRRVGRIRAFSADCELDAGGRRVFWLTGTKPAESVAWLTSIARGVAPGGESSGKEEKRLMEAAVFAVSAHGDPSADVALEQMVAPDQNDALRKSAIFWLGAARGRRGYEVLRRVVTRDPSPQVRERAIFALYISKEPEAVEAIIESAKNDQSTHVRGQALFWLAQKAGKKAVGAISDAVENDPDTEVKKKAVFALSQLPKSEGVPLLIQVARTNRNAAVRKQAIFWLGQSNDPLALAFFEEVLKP